MTASLKTALCTKSLSSHKQSTFVWFAYAERLSLSSLKREVTHIRGTGTRWYDGEEGALFGGKEGQDSQHLSLYEGNLQPKGDRKSCFEARCYGPDRQGKFDNKQSSSNPRRASRNAFVSVALFGIAFCVEVVVYHVPKGLVEEMQA